MSIDCSITLVPTQDVRSYSPFLSCFGCPHLRSHSCAVLEQFLSPCFVRQLAEHHRWGEEENVPALTKKGTKRCSYRQQKGNKVTV